ncbi:MAG: hypothetical protein ACYC8V_05985 [Caulobacteraceae bacterium]
MTPDVNEDADSQDLAEVFDETNITSDGRDIAHPDMAPDVFDVTMAAGDDDDDEAVDDGDFEPDEADETEIDRMLARDDGIDEPNPPTIDDEALVASDDDSSADFESTVLSDDQTAELGYRDRPGRAPSQPSPPRQRLVDDRLDEGLEETFPASDPVSINPGAD